MGELKVDPATLRSSGVEVGQIADTVKAAFAAADAAVASAQSGWVGTSANALASLAGAWQDATTTHHANLVAHAEKKLGCKLGESTADGRVYLKREEECVAACCGAPVVVINGHYHEKLDAAKVDELLDGLK